MPDPAAEMRYGELACEPRLSPWVAAHWSFEVDPRVDPLEHRVPLTGSSMIFVGELGPPMLVGPRTEPLVTVVEGGDRFRGTHLWPWATGALFDAAELAGRVVRLSEAADERAVLHLEGVRTARSAADAVPFLDRFWRDLVDAAEPLDDAVVAGAARIVAASGSESIAAVAEAAGLSSRQFLRRFRAAVGLTPKQLARIQRARTAAVDLVEHADRSWADRAARCGYADQAHLSREARRFFGTTPKEVESHLRRIAHGALLR